MKGLVGVEVEGEVGVEEGEVGVPATVRRRAMAGTESRARVRAARQSVIKPSKELAVVAVVLVAAVAVAMVVVVAATVAAVVAVVVVELGEEVSVVAAVALVVVVALMVVVMAEVAAEVEVVVMAVEVVVVAAVVVVVVAARAVVAESVVFGSTLRSLLLTWGIPTLAAIVKYTTSSGISASNKEGAYSGIPGGEVVIRCVRVLVCVYVCARVY